MEAYFIDTWLGSLGVYFERNPFLIGQIRLPARRGDRRQWPAEQAPLTRKTVETPPAELRAVVQMLRDFFDAGKPMETPWQWLPVDRLRPLHRQVLGITAAIPFGRVRSYGEIAVQMGKPTAARYVGNALAANPWPLLIACHRVIRSDDAIGGFGGGTDMKEKLIAHETGGKHPVLAHRYRI